MSRNGSREDVELVDADSNDEQLLVATEISGTVSVAIAARADASEAQLEAAAADALKEVRHRFGLDTTNRCSECGSILPDEIEPGTGVYCDQCGTGQLVPDGGSPYCAECHRAVAREDCVDRDGEVYHRQCAPDDVVENDSLDRFQEGSR